MTNLEQLMKKLIELRPGTRFQVEWFVQAEIPEIDALALHDKGKLYDGKGARLMIGPPSLCHNNSLKLCMKYRWEWMHGFALSDDPCWRVHSWCVNKKGRIIETTGPRVVYFGIPMMQHPGFRLRAQEMAIASRQSR